MYVCMYVCMYIHTHTRMQIHACIYIVGKPETQKPLLSSIALPSVKLLVCTKVAVVHVQVPVPGYGRRLGRISRI